MSRPRRCCHEGFEAGSKIFDGGFRLLARSRRRSARDAVGRSAARVGTRARSRVGAAQSVSARETSRDMVILSVMGEAAFSRILARFRGHPMRGAERSNRQFSRPMENGTTTTSTATTTATAARTSSPSNQRHLFELRDRTTNAKETNLKATQDDNDKENGLKNRATAKTKTGHFYAA